MPLLAGVAYEGNRDINCIKILIDRVAREHGINVEISEHPDAKHSAHTAIVNYVPLYTESMFESACVDLAFYFTDQDNDTTNRRRLIQDKIESFGGLYSDKTVVGVAKPHFEAWLLADEDTVKNILQYAGDEPLPHSDLSSKSRLAALINESNISIMFDEAKEKICSEMNLSILDRCNIGFSEMRADFRQKIVNNL